MTFRTRFLRKFILELTDMNIPMAGFAEARFNMRELEFSREARGCGGQHLFRLHMAFATVVFEFEMGSNDLEACLIMVEAGEVRPLLHVMALQAVVAGGLSIKLLFVWILMAVNAEACLWMVKKE